RTDLTQAQSKLADLQHELDGADTTAAASTVDALRALADDARARTYGPDWSLATLTPVVGADLAAVRTIANTLDDLCRNGFLAMVELAGSITLTDLVPRGGQLDLAALVPLAARIAPVMAVVQRSTAALAALDVDRLDGEVATAVTAFRAGLDRIA